MATPEVPPLQSPQEALAYVYLQHYVSLVRLAAFLTHDPARAEDIAQEAYVRVASRSRRLDSPDHGLAYLRASVVNLTRQHWRHMRVVDKWMPVLQTRASTIDDATYRAFSRQQIVLALRTLPERQREVIALRYLLDMTEAETAKALEISVGAVKSYSSRGMTKLRHMMETQDE